MGTAEVALDSLTASDLAADSVGSSEIAAGAVGSSEVSDGSLTSSDIFTMKGTVTLDPGSILPQTCSNQQSAASSVLGIQVGDTAIVTPPSGINAALTVSATHQTAADRLTVRICNISSPGRQRPRGDLHLLHHPLESS